MYNTRTRTHRLPPPGGADGGRHAGPFIFLPAVVDAATTATAAPPPTSSPERRAQRRREKRGPRDLTPQRRRRTNIIYQRRLIIGLGRARARQRPSAQPPPSETIHTRGDTTFADPLAPVHVSHFVLSSTKLADCC